MQPSEHKTPSLIKLGKLANARKFDALEELWPQAIEATDYGPRELMPIAGQVGRQGSVERAETLIDLLLESIEAGKGAEAALAAGRLAAGQMPTNDTVRELLSGLYERAHGETAERKTLLATLFAEKVPLDRTVALVDTYLQLEAGAYLVDHAYLIPGSVESVDPSTGIITALFDDRHNEYGPSTLDKITPLPTDHFPSLVLYDPDRLRELAHEDALAFVTLALQSERDGELSYRDLKRYVVRLLGEKGWKAWWPNTRTLLKRASRIGLGGGSQPFIRQLRCEDNYEDRLRRRFERERDPLKRLRQVLEYLDESLQATTATTATAATADSDAEADPATTDDLLLHFGNSAAKIAVEALTERPALALAGLAVHAAVAERGVAVARPNPRAATAVLARIEDKVTLAAELPEVLLVRTLAYLREVAPADWPQVHAAVLVRGSKRICDLTTRVLMEAGQTAHLQAAIDQALAAPTASPDLVCWLWRSRHTAATGKQLAEYNSTDRLNLAATLLGLIATAGQLYAFSDDDRHLRALESARAALGWQSAKAIRAVLEEADWNAAVRLQGLLEDNQGLTADIRSQLVATLRAGHPDLFVEITRPWEEREVIYSTDAGLQSRQRQLNEIIEIEIPLVAKQIGVAAAFGDLSENAEFTAALEKRDQLTSRATAMEAELTIARAITIEMANSDYVNIGTHVAARDLLREVDEQYTFLGPWDTDTERGVLNYRAPLSLAFMGKRVGDEVVYGEDDDGDQDNQQRRWEVLRIESAL